MRSFQFQEMEEKKNPSLEGEKNQKKNFDYSPAFTACSMQAFTPLPSGLGSVMWCASQPKAPPANSQMMLAPRLCACSSDSSTKTPAPSFEFFFFAFFCFVLCFRKEEESERWEGFRRSACGAFSLSLLNSSLRATASRSGWKTKKKKKKEKTRFFLLRKKF